MNTWDILVPTFYGRTRLFLQLLEQLDAQIRPGVRVIVARDDRTEPLGDKCQRLMEASTADYTCLCGDDALLHPEYVSLIHGAMEYGPDCIGFMLQYWGPHGPMREPQPHSIAFRDAFGLDAWGGAVVCDFGTWMPVKRSIGSLVRFEGAVDDEGWTRGVVATGLLRREVYFSEVLVRAQVLDQGFHGRWDPVEPSPDPQRDFVTYI